MSTLGKTSSALDLDEAQRLYNSGLSFEQLGRRLGFTKSYLAQRFRAAGIPVRPSGRPLTTPGPAVDVNRLVRLRETGWTFGEIGEALGISMDQARARYRRAKGLPLRRSEVQRFLRPAASDMDAGA